MSNSLCITLAQLNFLVGDIEGNTQKIMQAIVTARDTHHANLIVFSELTLTGYPPEDLLYRADLHTRIKIALSNICEKVVGIDVILGYPALTSTGCYNRASFIHHQQITHTYDKQYLPNYGVFDEIRYFKPGPANACIVDIHGIRTAITICEDLWHPEPIAQITASGADLILSINASPFSAHKNEYRQQIIRTRIQESKLPILYVNQIGGQDELLFDGGSMAFDHTANLIQQAPFFEEHLFTVTLSKNSQNYVQIENPLSLLSQTSRPLAEPAAVREVREGWSRTTAAYIDVREDSSTIPPNKFSAAVGLCKKSSEEERIYKALMLGVRDYVQKNGFTRVLLGLSGGIDSALTLAIAVDALGRENVHAVMMPSRYSAQMSLEDAKQQAETMNVHYDIVSIESAFQAFLETLQPVFFSKEEIVSSAQNLTEENLQARCRGTLLMALANKKHAMVLTTSNKSETAVGYATLYGDMAGGFCVLKDVLKTMVYRLARYRNCVSPVIPERVITRPPSAELSPDQKDEDSLPPYPVLDGILAAYVERDESVQMMVEAGFDEATVRRVIQMVDRNEYKRRQSAPGTRITERAFGKDRRYPMTSGFRAGNE